MERRDPPLKRDLKPTPPKWSSPLWFLPLMLLLLWFWQSTIVSFAFKTIPYSEFKEHLAKGEVIECAVKETTIEGSIRAKSASVPETSASNSPTAEKTTIPPGKETFFRTVRVEDPKLVEDLEAQHVKFKGER